MPPSRDPQRGDGPNPTSRQRGGNRSQRAKAAQERAERIREEQRQRRARRQRVIIAAAATAIVVVAVVTMVVISQTRDHEKPAAKPSGEAASAVVAAATSVSPQILDQVGKGSVLAKPKKVTDQPLLTADGKPLVLYVGAEYCPFCASQRWAVVVALSRFGKFSDLGLTHSASDDVHPNTQSFSFHGASYTSQYLVFQGVELAGNVRDASGNYPRLDKLTPEQQSVFDKMNAPPYASSKGSIPFMDLGNKYLLLGGAYKADTLQNKSHQQIAADLSNPTSPVAKGILGTANMLTAYLCQLTGGQPGEVCQSAAAQAFAGDV